MQPQAVKPLKTALVTGGSRGIGLATALELARAGYCTWIAARHEDALSAACVAAQKQHLRLESLSMDVRQPEEVERGFAHLLAATGSLDLLVHAAGSEAFSLLESPEDPQLWRETLDINLNGAYYCSRAAALQMQGQQSGRIVLISSVLGLRGMRHSHAYCASKHGVVGLMRALSQDLADQGITVNAICPGWVRTEMGSRSMQTIARHYQLEPELFTEAELAAIPIQRWIEPEEIAATVLYLASDAAAALTGQALEISGGL